MKNHAGQNILPPDAATQIFAKAREGDKQWEITKRIIYQNTLREAWLTGSFLYETLVQEIYCPEKTCENGRHKGKKSIDIIVR
ncbi:hypothetical protein D6825_03215, partial [Candidatus Woesearchaeota archaeon]